MEKSKFETILNEVIEVRDVLQLKANLAKEEVKDGYEKLEKLL